jgi:hypothetical protein
MFARSSWVLTSVKNARTRATTSKDTKSDRLLGNYGKAISEFVLVFNKLRKLKLELQLKKISSHEAF